MNGVVNGVVNGSVAGPHSEQLHPFSGIWRPALFAADLLMLIFASEIVLWLVHRFVSETVSQSGALLSGFLTGLLCCAIFERLGLYQRSYARTFRDEFYAMFAAIVLGTVPLMLLYTIVPAISTSRLVLLGTMGVGLFTVGGTRALLHLVSRPVNRALEERALIVGTAPFASRLAERLHAGSFRSVGIAIVDSVAIPIPHAASIANSLGGEDGWLPMIVERKCDLLILTEMPRADEVTRLLDFAAPYNVRIAFALGCLQPTTIPLHLRTISGVALAFADVIRIHRPLERAAKRAFDIALASIALLLFSPLMLLVAIAIRVDSPGPVIYSQTRVGRFGREFKVLKFRSMRLDAEAETGPVWASRADRRITRIGSYLRRASLDELPQLFNVLHGDMSIVGPRPERPEFVSEFRRTIPRYDERHLVRPGITGWAQVHLRRVMKPSDVSEKLRMDLFYVENASLFLDIVVVVKTAFEVLFHRAA